VLDGKNTLCLIIRTYELFDKSFVAESVANSLLVFCSAYSQLSSVKFSHFVESVLLLVNLLLLCSLFDARYFRHFAKLKIQVELKRRFYSLK